MLQICVIHHPVHGIKGLFQRTSHHALFSDAEAGESPLFLHPFVMESDHPQVEKEDRT
jgi:hypothetical protein